MREIKFRKWYLGEMDYSPGIWADGEGQVLVNHYFESEDEGRWMQYTGLKDKYGIDIYEGDIIDCEIYGQKHRGVVQYADMLAVYYLTGLSRSDKELWLASKKQIIGNKYEHPHLFESEDDL